MDLAGWRSAAHEASEPGARVRERVIGTAVDVVARPQSITRVRAWAARKESRYVCFCNVHALVTGRRDGRMNAALAQSDLVAPDGAPVAWMLRRLGHGRQERINGPDFFWAYCDAVAAAGNTAGESIYLLGGSEQTLAQLQLRLTQSFPGLRIAGAYSPPFRPLTDEEDQAMIDAIHASGAGTVWVGLGCPKQEIWMNAHKGRIHAVMLGVGAAFDFHAGTLRLAPAWMRECGLEWLHRLLSEPRRLWKRYLTTNTAFLVLVARQLLERPKARAPHE
jgi:N-acetylglucosaminyldiphosphoundecaprenol N-acetyl-beta-D-mannosaminyltransferase